jgi:hypothetical protein
MSERNLPIQLFDYREGDEKPTEGGGGTEAKWLLTIPQLVKKSEQLLAELNAFENIVSERERKQSIIPFVCKAKLEKKATAKSRRPYVEKILNTSRTRSNIIGIVDKEELVVRIDSLDDLNAILQNIKDYERNVFGLSCLDRIIPFTPQIIASEKAENLKVKLLDFQDYNDNLAIFRQFEKVMQNNKIDFKKVEYAEAFLVYKVQGDQSVMLDVFKQNDVFEALFSIKPMPQYSLSLDSVPFEETVPIKNPASDKNYATLGILDNGIAKIPHLEPWLSG